MIHYLQGLLLAVRFRLNPDGLSPVYTNINFLRADGTVSGIVWNEVNDERKNPGKPAHRNAPDNGME